MHHALIKDIQHRIFFVYAQLQSGIFEGYVTDKDTESDRDKQHRLKLFGYCQIDEDTAEKYHYQISNGYVGETCIGKKFIYVLT